MLLHEKIIVFFHQAIAVVDGTVACGCGFEVGQEFFSVSPSFRCGFAFLAAWGDVLEGSGICDAQWSGHGLEFYVKRGEFI